MRLERERSEKLLSRTRDEKEGNKMGSEVREER